MEKLAVTIKVDKEALNKFDIICLEKGKTRSEYIGSLVDLEVERILRTGLFEYLLSAKNKLGIDSKDMDKAFKYVEDKKAKDYGKFIEDALFMGIEKDKKEVKK